MSPNTAPHAERDAPDLESLVASYGSLFQRLSPRLVGSLFVDRNFAFLGSVGTLAAQRPVVEWLSGLWRGRSASAPVAREISGGATLVGFPFVDSRGDFIGAVCVQLAAARSQGNDAIAKETRDALGPALECLHREYSRLRDGDGDEATVERTQDLEWLFNVTGDIKRAGGDSHLLRNLLGAACQRMEATLAMVSVPDKQLSLLHESDAPDAAALRDSAGKAEPHLLAWATRRREPLLVNEPPRPPSPVPPVKFLSVPVVASGGRVLGVLAFFRGPKAAGFTERQQYLAGHLARQVIQLVESQFDLMTGLPTRAALEQSFDGLCRGKPDANRSILYFDIDELHVCNETHGFELGDELIVRVAQVLTAGLLPDHRLVARISADSFAAIIDDTDPRDAAPLAAKLQEAVRAIRIGPATEPLKVSVSCGVAAIVDMPKGFARALAAAELACKTAKDRGRDRVEVYACEDSSMMRRHDDVILVGQLREAIRAERLVLFAQPIVALKGERPVCGFEVLLRMRNEDGTMTPPATFMSAAQRYQLLPQIDRYVLRRALEIAIPYRGLLREMKASISVNVSGQSIGDESFVDYMLKTVRESQIPPGLITCEITEQTAVSSLAKAGQMMAKLRAAGCGVALDDFGVGANTFAYLKGLPATRLKIDGSFVKDMLTNRKSAAMVQSLVALAKQFDLETVGEYVENDDLARKLQEIGVEYGQGYHFGRPEDMETVLRRLRDDESKRLRTLWLES
ncbi:MAG TPA: GGDEF domain-containing protein [Steroidobacteraceae bacterium]|nr:GGDEF domain-containing protein [Steroidobacteraceae bacterium]